MEKEWLLSGPLVCESAVRALKQASIMMAVDSFKHSASRMDEDYIQVSNNSKVNIY